MSEDKTAEYAAKLYAHIKEIFNEKNDYHISLDELSEENNLAIFFHALSNVVPYGVYARLTHRDTDLLGFNHLANRLLFQF